MSAPTPASQTLVPPPGLVVPNPSPAGGPAVLCLLTKDSITIQVFIAQVLPLPATVSDFKAKYGTFTDDEDIEGCVAAIQALQKVILDFGDPTAVVKELATNPAVFQGDTAPAQLYLHIVWFATRFYQTANIFNQTLGQFMHLLNTTPPDQRQAVVTETLTGDGGLQAQASSMQQLGNDLTQAMAAFNLNLTSATAAMSAFSGEATKFYKDVVNDIKVDTDEDDKQKKLQLLTDLKSLDMEMAAVNSAAQNFANNLAKVEGVWLVIGDDLDSIVNQLPGQFNDVSAWATAVKLDDASGDWKTVAAAASSYTENSLVPCPLPQPALKLSETTL
jgi:hypothetical protein